MRYLFSIILYLLTLCINAQYYPLHHFTEEDGLVDNAVQDLLMDKEGYLWIATNNGISKFDGHTFKNIYKSDGLLNNRVWALACDDENNIWAGCYKGGLNKIAGDSVVASFKMNLEQYDNSVRKLHYSNRHNALLVGTDNGLYIFKDSIFSRVQTPIIEDKYKSSVLAIDEDSGRIFFTMHGGMNGGVFELKIDSVDFSHSTFIELRCNTHYALEVVGDSIYTNEIAIEKWSIKANNSDTIYQPIEDSFLTWDMCSNGKDKIWLSGWGGDNQFAKVKEYTRRTGIVKDVPFQLFGESFVTNFYDKRAGMLWVGGNGLFALKEGAFVYYDMPEIQDVAKFDEKTFFLNTDGLNVYKEGSPCENFSIKALDTKVKQLHRQRRLLYGIDDTTAWFRHYRSDFPLKLLRFIHTNNQYWLLTNKGSISLPDFKEYLPFESGKFTINDNGEVYWIRDYELIRHYSHRKDLKNPRPLEGLARSVRDVVKIVPKGDTLLFPSHFNGLFALVGKQAYELNSKHSFDDIIIDTDLTPDNEIWCTSQDGNLFHVGLNDSLYVISKFNKNHGIRGTKYNWLKFHNKHLYIGSNKGLNVISTLDLKKGNFDNILFFNKYNGYPFINSTNPQVDSDGRLFVHTSDKIIYIDIDKASFNELAGLTVDSKINEKATLIDNAILSYDQNKIELNFKTIMYPTAKNIRYSYQINRGSWQNGNHIKLESIETGDYRIEIRAIDIATNKSVSSIINFTINEAFWRSNWFVIACLILFVVIVYYISTLRIRKIRKQADEREQLNNRLNEISIRSLQGQLNPHFIFNALNSIQYFILSKNVKDALLYLGNLSGVIRQNLHNLGQEMIPLEDEVKFIKEYLELEKLRFKEKLEYSINVRIHSAGLNIPPMLIQPILENAIKHGIMNSDHSDEIWIDIAESNVLSIIIKDNGVGRKVAKELANSNGSKTNGKAIEITKERIELLNKKFKTNQYTFNIEDVVTEDGECEGTLVSFTLMVVK